MDESPPRAHHDLGGIPKFMCERIDTAPHELSEFDRTVDALRGVLGARGVISVDELRCAIEAIPEAEYHSLTYYQRWMRAMTDHLLLRGILTEADILAALP